MEKNVSWIEEGYYLFDCPNCDAPIQVDGNEVNCRIFRHGQFKNTYTIRTDILHMALTVADIQSESLKIGSTVQFKNPTTGEFESGIIHSVHQGKQLPPHSSQILCDQLFDDGLIWGCGKPFQLQRGDDGRVKYATKCGYI